MSDEDNEHTETIDVGGHDVYPEQKSVLPCPVCSEREDAYYLGSHSLLTAGDEPRSFVVSGWVCSGCESTLEVTDEDLMAGSEQVSEDDMTVVETSEGER